MKKEIFVVISEKTDKDRLNPWETKYKKQFPTMDDADAYATEKAREYEGEKDKWDVRVTTSYTFN